ncbi:uncharacterized protein LOC120329695 [Styela clava]|uniref:uncharacterized protein LOC120329695 n=1 Tax=Styela clava TaxID=7725 RepID=UPI00193A4220|nr:uncharacterized protein LOC120329695 [Styela clava]
MRYLVIVAVFGIFIVSLTEGCQGGSRRKRSVPTAPEVDTKLAAFFDDCLRRPASGIFESLRSVVDSVIRDSVWYKEVEDDVCSGNRDVAECWIYTLPFLMDTASTLYQPTAQCICDWAGTCWEPPKHPQKRSTLYSYKDTRDTPPPRKPKQKPLSTSLKQFSQCVDKNAKPFVRQYPSLRRISGKSISIFLRDHFTFCRSIPDFPYDQRNLFVLLYIDRVCPKSGPKSRWRSDTIGLYKEYSRRDGPLVRIVQQCHKPADPCKPNPCKNRGKCKNVGYDSYKCDCYYGYTGKHCESDPYSYRAGGYIDDKDCIDEASYCPLFNTCNQGIEKMCRMTCGLC